MADKVQSTEQKPVADAPASTQQHFDDKLDNNAAMQKTADRAQGLFVKMGLKPLESFCCCAPNVCGLRGVVLVLSILQIAYAGVLLLVSLFMSLWGAIAYGSYHMAGGTVLLVLVFLFQLIMACLYLVSGIYGLKATFDLQAVINLNPVTVRNTQLHYKLNLVAFLVGAALGLLATIFASIAVRGYAVASIVFQWIWYLVYVGMAGYFLFTVWSYSHWITSAANGDSSALQKAVNLDGAAPSAARPVAAPSQQTTATAAQV
eukprot:jgi/Tetstr1/439006/TSEL_027498.t1